VTSALAALLLLAAPALHLGQTKTADRGLPCPAHAAVEGALRDLLPGLRVEGPGALDEGDLEVRLARETGKWLLSLRHPDGKVALQRALALPARDCALLGRTAALVVDRYLEDVRWPGRPPRLLPLPAPEALPAPPLPVPDALPPVPERPRPLTQDAPRPAPDKAGGAQTAAGSDRASQQAALAAGEAARKAAAEKAAAEKAAAEKAAVEKAAAEKAAVEKAAAEKAAAEKAAVEKGAVEKGAAEKAAAEKAAAEKAAAEKAAAEKAAQTALAEKAAADEAAAQRPPRPEPRDGIADPLSPMPLHLALLAGPGLYLGLPSDVRFALSAGALLRRGRVQFGLSLAGTAASGQPVVAPNGAQQGRTQVRTGLLALSAGVCNEGSVLLLCGGPAAGLRLSLGSLAGAQIVQPGSAALLQPALGAHGTAGLRLTERLELSLDLLALWTPGSARFDVAGAPSRTLSVLDLTWALRLGWLAF
jgi:hypothetical protein